MAFPNPLPCSRMVDSLGAITCGQPLASVAVSGFVVTDVHYTAGDTYLCHAHERGYLILLCSGGFADTRSVRIARELIEANSEQPLRFSEVARQAGVTAPHLARTFRRSFGRTMGAHLRSARARRAAAMLASSNDALADIAIAAGFADQ